MKRPPSTQLAEWKRLRPKHQRFIAEYLRDQNGSQAAIRSGYKSKPDVIGSQLLGNPRIRAVIDAELKRITEAAGLTQQKIREAWRRAIDADVRKLYDAEGHPRPIESLEDNEAALLAGVESVETANLDPTDGKRDPAKVRKYRLVERSRYLEQAAKHLGMFVEKVEHAGEIKITWEK